MYKRCQIYNIKLGGLNNKIFLYLVCQKYIYDTILKEEQFYENLEVREKKNLFKEQIYSFHSSEFTDFIILQPIFLLYSLSL